MLWFLMIHKIKLLLILLWSTVTEIAEDKSRCVNKDVKTTYHYSTCVFTNVTCGDLDLDWYYL